MLILKYYIETAANQLHRNLVRQTPAIFPTKAKHLIKAM